MACLQRSTPTTLPGGRKGMGKGMVMIGTVHGDQRIHSPSRVTVFYVCGVSRTNYRHQSFTGIRQVPRKPDFRLGQIRLGQSPVGEGSSSEAADQCPLSDDKGLALACLLSDCARSHGYPPHIA